jgi:hypothetical protein
VALGALTIAVCAGSTASDVRDFPHPRASTPIPTIALRISLVVRPLAEPELFHF